MESVGDCSVRSVWTSWGRTNHVPTVGGLCHCSSQTIEVGDILISGHHNYNDEGLPVTRILNYWPHPVHYFSKISIR